jgi:hypothetical protein
MEKEYFEKIVKESKTINEVLSKLGKNTSSASYNQFKLYVTKNNIDISHFWTKKDVINNQFKNGKLKKININELFTENSLISRGTIKKRILSEKIIEYKCVFCENDGKWRGKKISLILDHINGINNDHRLENLRFVCPNCNATLDTHCMGVKGFELKKETKKKKERNYTPRINKRKVERPDIEILKKQINDMGFVKTGKLYGVSDNSIRKWLKWANNRP